MKYAFRITENSLIYLQTLKNKNKSNAFRPWGGYLLNEVTKLLILFRYICVNKKEKKSSRFINNSAKKIN